MAFVPKKRGVDRRMCSRKHDIDLIERKDYKYCPACGRKIRDTVVYFPQTACSECGEFVDRYWKFCPNCATPAE